MPVKQPQDHQPKSDSEDAKPAGWELLKPFDQVPVWDQTELIAIVQPLLASQEANDEGKVDFDLATFDVRVVGHLAQKLQEYATDPDAYLQFVSGPGALVRAMELGIAYATQLGE